MNKKVVDFDKWEINEYEGGGIIPKITSPVKSMLHRTGDGSREGSTTHLDLTLMTTELNISVD